MAASSEIESNWWEQQIFTWGAINRIKGEQQRRREGGGAWLFSLSVWLPLSSEICVECREKLLNPPELRLETQSTEGFLKMRVHDLVVPEYLFFINLVVNTTFFPIRCRTFQFLQVKCWEANCWSQISFRFGLCLCVVFFPLASFFSRANQYVWKEINKVTNTWVRRFMAEVYPRTAARRHNSQ